MSELNQLRNLGDRIVPPSFELLRETARRQTRRNWIGGAAAAVAVGVVIGSAAFLTGAEDRGAPEPAGPPYDVSTTHPLTYALGTTIHYGDRTAETPAQVVELDVTDAGVVARTEDGGIWFTDGDTLDQVGTLGEPGSAYGEPGSGYAAVEFPHSASGGFVVSDNTGSRAAWLEFPRTGEPELVVYDTQNASETARVPLRVEPGSYALLAWVTDRYGYWYTSPETIEDHPLPQQRIDLASGTSEALPQEAYEAHRPGPNTPRTIMITHAEGDEPVKWWVHDATMWPFGVWGGRMQPTGLMPLNARDGGTGQRFAFDPPEGYARDGGTTWLTQWLDDDTVVITQNRGGNDDLLECRHSTGTCILAERLPEAAVLPEAN